MTTRATPMDAGVRQNATLEDDAAGVPFDGRPTPRSWIGWLQVPEQWMRHRRSIASSRRLLARNRREGREPVFVFCHPRVGSRSLYMTLANTPGFAPFHLLTITRARSRFRHGQPVVSEDGIACNSAASAFVAREYIASASHTRFVVSLRDPISVNVSFFVFWGRKYWFRDQWARTSDLDDAALARLFLERFPHKSALRWLDREFTEATGLDTRAHEFDAERGAGVLRSAKTSALILRADIPDASKREELSAFLGSPIAKVIRGNEIGSRYPEQAGLTERLRRVVPGIPGYVDAMLGCPFARRHWTPTQLEALRASWLERARGESETRD
ncbi:MAG: putative capsular polysaccharide synthesis family protein [bacterium]